ncbi:MAG TPA: hypothetical protein VIG48_09635 [Jatrophihabitans sp.]
MTLKPPQETFVHTATELTDLWADLMGAGGFSLRSLWMIFIRADGQMAPVGSPIDDIPPEPDEFILRNFRHVIGELADEGEVSAAFLLARPGPSQVLVGDRHWASALTQALGPRLSPWPVHLATAGRVRVIAPDDLVAA